MADNEQTVLVGPSVGRGELFAAVTQLVADNQRLIKLLGEASVVSNRHRIRWAVTTIILAVITAVQFHDIHIERCVAHGGPATRATQFICNVTFPTHTHSDEFPGYPVPGQLVGVLAYSAVVGASAAWAKRERSREKASDAVTDGLVNGNVEH